MKVEDGHGFKNIKNVIRLEFTYEACGYENGEIIFLWDGVKLTYVATAYQVSEAGVFHYYYEMIFPDAPENASPDILKVYQISEEEVYIEEDPDNQQNENTPAQDPKVSITLKQYKWDGVKVTSLPEEFIKN